ncbi:MAG TPA: carbohydrate ABC transporter permease [Anaerolineales bacterium]|nr:carbohydrate ABC transporter permease [Anaerolineales bacterium]
MTTSRQTHRFSMPRLLRTISQIPTYVFMSVFLIYFLIPLFWLLISSTKTNAGLFSTFGLWFGKDFNFFQNLKDLFAYDNGHFALWMKNTAIYALIASLGSSFISAMAGYAFAQYRFAGRDLLFGIVLGSIFVPATVFAVPLFLLMSKSGLSNSLWAIILPSLVNPFGVYLMRIYAQQAVPQDLIDAARVDGAGEFRIFVTIVFRLIAPGYVTVLLFAFVGAWNNYFLPLLLLSKSDLYLLTVGLAYWNSLASQPGVAHVLYILVVTGSVVAIIPVMIVFLFLQRYWQGGLTLGSIKE